MDGVLYSCDFSTASPTDQNGEVVLTLDDLTSLGNGRRASQAQARLESARRSLKDRQQAKRALEAALRLSAPVKDDLSLAEEMSKCEGLMTRTGLKRVAGTEGAGVNSSVVLSIPFAKTKKSEAVNSKKGVVKRQSPSRPPPHDNTQRTAELKNKKVVPASTKLGARLKSDQKAAGTLSQTTAGVSPLLKEESSDVTVSHSNQAFLFNEVATRLHYVPCNCAKSPSSALEFTGKGWEGTATLNHGSRLHFGCLQFILSLAGQPGHKELVQALNEQPEQGPLG